MIIFFRCAIITTINSTIFPNQCKELYEFCKKEPHMTESKLTVKSVMLQMGQYRDLGPVHPAIVKTKIHELLLTLERAGD